MSPLLPPAPIRTLIVCKVTLIILEMYSTITKNTNNVLTAFLHWNARNVDLTRLASFCRDGQTTGEVTENHSECQLPSGIWNGKRISATSLIFYFEFIYVGCLKKYWWLDQHSKFSKPNFGDCKVANFPTSAGTL